MLAARRETLSIYSELRAMAWIGVMLIATGVGILVKKHFDDIGPLAIAIAIGVAAAACYAWAAIKQRAALDEYVVLLGALLISADFGFVEHQWHLLGSNWRRHLLVLALLHAIAAYRFGSRAVLSLALTAFAAWLGVEREPNGATEWAIRAFVCAGIVGLFRLANRRKDFHPVFEHFAANIAFWGAVTLAARHDTRALGMIGLVMAAAAIVYGFRTGREMFVIYGYVYGLVIIDVVAFDILHSEVTFTLFLLLSTVAVIVAMFVTHLRFRHVADV